MNQKPDIRNCTTIALIKTKIEQQIKSNKKRLQKKKIKFLINAAVKLSRFSAETIFSNMAKIKTFI